MSERPPRVPPRWFVTTAWKVHRGIYRLSRGRRGLWPARPAKWGTMHVTTTGRRSGREREVILGYLEDGQDLVTLAMNGWGEGDPAWWLNLKAHPRARVRLKDRTVDAVAHEATGADRERLWQRYLTAEPKLDGYAAQRSTPTAVVVLSPVGADT
ncbi:nitroreductase/quinone reductase family protein [Thalassiella azotivora]